MTEKPSDRAVSREHEASAFIVAIENYERHQKLEGLSAAAEELAAALETGGFVDAMPAGRDGGTASELAPQLKSWFEAANSEQRLLLFWSGHGELEGSRLWLMTRDSPTSRFDHITAVQPSFIAKKAAESKARRILIVLDACHSGKAAGEVIAELSNVLGELAPSITGGRGVAVIASAHAVELAQVGVISRLLKDALTNASFARRWSDSDRFIDSDRLVDALDDRARSEGIEQQIISASYGRAGELIPNPRYRAGLSDENVEERSWRLSRPDAAAHFELAARGIEVGEEGWFFSGRRRLLKQLVEWLRSAEHGVRIVTGTPGSGKSAVLGRLATLSDEEYRQAALRAGEAKEVDEAVPPVGAIDVAVHAKGKSLDDCARALARGLGVTLGPEASIDTAKLVTDIGSLSRSLTLMIDALDEAAGGQGQTIATQLIVPLGRLPRIRVLVGSRRSLDGSVIPKGEDRHGRLLAVFGADAPIDDLQDEQETEGDIAEYVRRRLATSEKHRYKDKTSLAEAAERVAARADGGFLYARIVSRTLQEQDQLDGALPATALEAFEQDIAARFEGDERRVEDLLGALAWGEGKGLTRRVWPIVASALTIRERPYLDDDIAWALGHAGWHIIEAGEGGQAVYRLGHQALADHYRGRFEGKEAQGRIVAALRQGVQGASWLDCDRYLWRHLADHAQGSSLAELIRDPGYLAVADPVRLVVALRKVDFANARRFADIYNRAVDRLIGLSPIERMPLIHMTAQMEDPELAPTLEAPVPTRWRCRWAHMRPSAAHRIIGRHAGGVKSVAWGAIDGRPVVVSGGDDREIQIWDPRTGLAIRDPISGKMDWSGSLVWGTIGGQPIIASRDGHNIFLLDARTGELICPPLQEQNHSLAWGEVDGQPVVVSGGFSSITLWDACSGQKIWRQFKGLEGVSDVSAIAFGSVDRRPIVVWGGKRSSLGARSAAFGFCDARVGEPIGRPTKVRGDVLSLSCGEIDGRPYVVAGTATNRYPQIRLWDVQTRKLVWRSTNAQWLGHPVAWGAMSGRSMIASQSLGWKIWLLDPKLAKSIGPALEGHTKGVASLAWGETDGRPVLVSACGDGTVRLWEPRIEQSLEEEDFVGSRARRSAIGVNRTRISRCWDRLIRLWTVPKAKVPFSDLQGHQNILHHAPVAFGAVDGRSVAIGRANWKVHAWDTWTGEARGGPFDGDTRYLTSITHGAVNGRPAVLLGSYITYALVDARTGKKIAPEFSDWHGTGSVAWGSIDARPVIATGRKNGVQLWEVLPWRQQDFVNMVLPIPPVLVAHPDTNSPRLDLKLQGAVDYNCATESVAWGEIDGRPVVTAASGDGTIRLWDAKTRDLISTKSQNANTSGPWRGETIVWGSVSGRPVIVSNFGGITLWDARTFEQRGPVLLTGKLKLNALGTINGNQVVVGGDDRSIQLWDIAQKRRIFYITVQEPILGIAATGNGEVLAGMRRGVAVFEFATMG
jgi:WD40 repeat protein